MRRRRMRRRNLSKCVCAEMHEFTLDCRFWQRSEQDFHLPASEIWTENYFFCVLNHFFGHTDFFVLLS